MSKLFHIWLDPGRQMNNTDKNKIKMSIHINFLLFAPVLNANQRRGKLIYVSTPDKFHPWTDIQLEV